MYARMWKFGLVVVLLVALVVVAGCGTPSPEQEIEQAVEATVEQVQTEVDTVFTDLGTAVDDALEKVGNLPSQQEAAEAITTDLQDIQSRLDDAIKSGGDDQLETFQSLGNGFDAVINNVKNAAEEASGEQKEALVELTAVLVGAKAMLADSINTMLAAEGKATVVSAEVEAAEAEATTEAEAAEAAATAEAEEVEAAATAETGEVEAEATAETEEVDAAATAAAGEESAEEAAADIVDTAVAAGDFTTLVAAVEAAGLVDTLKGEGPFTVFAPTDEAFAALPEGTVESLLEDPEGALTDVLLYHVVAAKVMAADAMAMDGQSAETVGGVMLPITVDGDTVMIGDAMVVATDIETSNGVIHVIDAVLVPPAE